MIHKVSLYLPLLLFMVGLLITGCSKSDDQRRFEQQAQAEPSGITETGPSGEITGSTDQDDWQIAPMFAGLVEIEKSAFPNPVPLNSNLRIEVNIWGTDILNRIEVYAFEFPREISGPFEVINNPRHLEALHLNTEAITGSSGGSGASGIYRLLLYDDRENLISYGDVRVE